MEIEEGYRRGAVLGLTIAEIFILLVFLMLLALMGVNRYWSEMFAPWKPIIEKYTPEEIKVALELPDELEQELERLKRQIDELEKDKKRLQQRIRTLVDSEGETGEKLEEALRLSDELHQQIERLRQQIEELKAEKERLQQRIRTLVDRERESGESDLKRENDVLREKMRIIGKGGTPPCWYQQIDDTNPITKANWREKPYYLFDIVIREDHMEVQPVPIPPGSAEDDGGKPYSDEAKGLGLDTIPYGKPLTDREMRDAMSRLYELGKKGQLRTYSCIFYVRVWDETPEASKDRWKRAHDSVLEQFFGTYQVRDVLWNDRAEAPANVPIAARRPAR